MNQPEAEKTTILKSRSLYSHPNVHELFVFKITKSTVKEEKRTCRANCETSVKKTIGNFYAELPNGYKLKGFQTNQLFQPTQLTMIPFLIPLIRPARLFPGE